jgi:NAD(P)-dependent dehydrogenase (short-subunit alcohol dehydrogenase family)
MGVLTCPEREPSMSQLKPAILVTGAAKRIGAAIVSGLVRDGWVVALHYHHSRQEAEALAASLNRDRRACFPIGADLSRRDEIEALISNTNAMLEKEARAKLSCLVNNANLFTYDSVANLTWELWEKALVPGLYAPVFLTKLFADTIPGDEHGLVINMLDQKLQNLNPDFFSYTIGKFGLWGATKTMALALAPRIRVCGIAPGITFPSEKQTAAQFERAWRKTPLGRSSTADEIVQAVRFIIDTNCATGSVIVLDGGESLMKRGRDVAFDV